MRLPGRAPRPCRHQRVGARAQVSLLPIIMKVLMGREVYNQKVRVHIARAACGVGTRLKCLSLSFCRSATTSTTPLWRPLACPTTSRWVCVVWVQRNHAFCSHFGRRFCNRIRVCAVCCWKPCKSWRPSGKSYGVVVSVAPARSALMWVVAMCPLHQGWSRRDACIWCVPRHQEAALLPGGR